MSLREKVIKNTFYHFLSQAFGFLSPFILTPIMIAYIGQVEFGMYAILMGFIGTFGLFDLSISTSFIKFISEHYNKKEFASLNSTINTGLFFYIGFSLIVCGIVLLFADYVLSLVNIPPGLFDTAKFALYISLVIFFLATSSTIFVSVLISIQKMYLNSSIGLMINICNFVLTYILLVNGYGLKGILISQLIAVAASVFFNVYLALSEMPEIKISPRLINRVSFRSMSAFGLQMQVSRVSGFLSEKYDEFLLGYFSTLNNVTFFNLSNRLVRLGKFFPLQLFQQVAPVAAELNAKSEMDKLNELFYEATKYLSVFSIPIFIYVFFFADLLITTWVGAGYELSVYLARILAAGQLVNLMISAPGNSIIPNLGKPKYLMYEGIISLAINLVLSFLLIKYYGIVGAAIGTTVSTFIASSYIYYTSVKYFGQNPFGYFIKAYLKPLLTGLFCTGIIFGLYKFFMNSFSSPVNRPVGITLIIITSLLTAGAYIFILLKSRYLNEKDIDNLRKLLKIINPFGRKQRED